MMLSKLPVIGLLLSAIPVLANPIDKRQSKTPVSQSFFDTLVRYGNFAAGSIFQPCAVPPRNSTVVQYIDNKLTDTQATLFRADDTKELIISYGGSSSIQDFITDFAFIPVTYSGCAGCKAHVGFYKAYQSVQNDSRNALDSAVAANPDYKITIVGHSLGGALASLAYADLVSSGRYPQISAAWSYGEPRVGNQAYADFVDTLSGSTDAQVGNFYRVTHANDGVPQLPSQQMGFEHHRTEFWASQQDSTAATTYQCVGQENPNCNDGAGGVFINQAHIYYPGIDYSKACTANQ